jgi:GDP-D-mannose dehydratase
MSSLSSTLTIHPTSENLTNAKTWADRSLKTVNAARSDRQRISPKQEQDMSDQDKATRDLCDTVRAAALFNLGVLHEVSISFSSPKTPDRLIRKRKLMLLVLVIRC